jgi:hypothetical protein
VRLTVAVVSIAVDEVAEQLYVDPGDIRVVLGTLTDEPIADARELAACCTYRRIGTLPLTAITAYGPPSRDQ